MIGSQRINDIDDLEHELETCWFDVLKNEFDQEYWKDIIITLNNGKYLPKKQDLFNALNRCPPSKVKVVIIGQDPYIHDFEACGYSFSVPKTAPIPPSLRNIFAELAKEYNYSMLPENGDITKWCDDGVLLLNSILTVEPGKSRSHKGIGWEKFTSAIIRYIDHHNKCVFMAWGKDAQKICSDEVKINKVLTAGHPSPLNTSHPFLGCNCFRECNDILRENKLLPVRWISIFNQ